MTDARRRLMWHGVFLFLLGLLSGLVEQNFKNPRMGLAAHLEGLMNGTFLLALGAVWAEVRLSARVEQITFWLALYGAYVNWATTITAAALGTAALTPLTSGSHRAGAWEEALVTFGFGSVGLVTIAMSLLILWGLRRGARLLQVTRDSSDPADSRLSR